MLLTPTTNWVSIQSRIKESLSKHWVTWNQPSYSKQAPLLVAFHNEQVPYPAMHHFVTEMCKNGALWDICLMHRGIWEMGLFQSASPYSGEVLFLNPHTPFPPTLFLQNQPHPDLRPPRESIVARWTPLSKRQSASNAVQMFPFDDAISINVTPSCCEPNANYNILYDRLMN